MVVVGCNCRFYIALYGCERSFVVLICSRREWWVLARPVGCFYKFLIFLYDVVWFWPLIDGSGQFKITLVA